VKSRKHRDAMKRGFGKVPIRRPQGGQIPLWGPHSIRIKRIKELPWRALRVIGRAGLGSRCKDAPLLAIPLKTASQ
jgi:hypothetical protein